MLLGIRFTLFVSRKLFVNHEIDYYRYNENQRYEQVKALKHCEENEEQSREMSVLVIFCSPGNAM